MTKKTDRDGRELLREARSRLASRDDGAVDSDLTEPLTGDGCEKSSG
jgi:hypothetical protein